MERAKQPQIPLYFLLAFAIPWIGSFIDLGPELFQGKPLRLEDMMVTGAVMIITPCLLGIALTGLEGGTDGLKELFSRMGKWKVGFRWYLAPLIFPILILLVLWLLAVFVSPEFRPTFFKPGIMMGLIAGFLEETGWMGFAYPRMRTKTSALKAALVLGLLHVLWHFGADFMGASVARGAYFLPHFLAFCVSMYAMRIILVWVYVNTKSLLMAQLMHASSTGFLGILISQSILPANDTLFYAVYSIALWIVAFIIIAKYGKDMIVKPSAVRAFSA